MSTSDTATILHLQTSAHSLVRQSPAIASHLYGRFLERANTKDIRLPSQLARSACAACNTVWIPGYNLQVLLHNSRKENSPRIAKRKDKQQRQSAKKAKENVEQDRISPDSSKVTSSNVSLRDNQTAVDGSSGGNGNKILCYICLTCGNVTRFSVPSASLGSQNKSILQIDIQAPVSTPQKGSGAFGVHTPVQDPPSSTKLSTSASSRKRQKLRKQNSLQQMLAKAKAERSGKQASEMKLMDIMKSAK
ncbi:hypothetical protein V1525DRAFT_453967 [Lipomyces kononenkoae]|uniref:Uncharacterized protein n=1 Tax=Lipomyces kononenkoae TaxID=34357 RepID=A0ACC3TAS8_LIPKO